MTEIKMDVTMADLYQQLGQQGVVLSKLQAHNQALNELVVRLNERIKQLEAENESLKDTDNIPVG